MEECIFVLILGRNNNPSTIEFTTSLKKIVLGATHKSQFSNCLIQDDTANIPLPSNLEETFVPLVEKRLSDKDILTEINVVEKLTNKTVRILNTLYPSLLNKLSDHADSCSITNNHKINLMKKISKQYISAVLKHFCRQHNNKDTKIRKLYSKLILFKNQ